MPPTCKSMYLSGLNSGKLFSSLVVASEVSALSDVDDSITTGVLVFPSKLSSSISMEVLYNKMKNSQSS